MANGTETPQSEVTLDAKNLTASIKSTSLNTLATVTTLILVAVLGYAVYVHANDTRDANKDLVTALKEMTQVTREQNCLISMPQDHRDRELCRQLSK